MGFRSHVRRIGIRLLESLVGSHCEHHLACRVCAAEQAIRADDQSICASHLLTHLDSLALKSQQTCAASHASVPTTLSPPAATTHTIRRKSLPRRLESQTMHSERMASVRYSADPTRRLAEPNGIVQSLQAALGNNLRYAISGHLGVQLQASRTDKGSHLFRDAFANITNNEDTEALQPTIVCPRSTLDVLPSWAAASRGQYTFRPEQGQGSSKNQGEKPSALDIYVEGTPTRVRIDWVDDEQFNCAPYVVEELATSCPSSTVRVLSVSSLINEASKLLGTCTDTSSSHQHILLNHVTIGLQIKQQQGVAIPAFEAPALYQYTFYSRFCTDGDRKSLYDHVCNEPRHRPVPASNVDKALPPIPASETSCLFQ